MRVALYARVSTGHQNVQQQLDMLKKYAKSQEWEIIHVVKGRLILIKSNSEFCS